jgi:hypothetical protein
VSALVSLCGNQIDPRHGLLHVARRKHGLPFHHPVRGPELQAPRRLQQDEPEPAQVFVSERRTPLTTAAILKIVG